MQFIIPKSMSYSVSDLVTWEVWLDGWTRELDLSSTPNPAQTNQTIETGIIKQTNNKEQLTLDAALGIQTQLGSYYKVFCRNLNATLEPMNSLLKMQSQVTPYGEEMPIIEGFFRVIQQPKRQNTENMIYLYKLI